VLRADIKPIVDGEAAHRAASPSISVLTYLRIAIVRVDRWRQLEAIAAVVAVIEVYPTL